MSSYLVKLENGNHYLILWAHMVELRLNKQPNVLDVMFGTTICFRIKAIMGDSSDNKLKFACNFCEPLQA